MHHHKGATRGLTRGRHPGLPVDPGHGAVAGEVVEEAGFEVGRADSLELELVHVHLQQERGHTEPSDRCRPCVVSAVDSGLTEGRRAHCTLMNASKASVPTMPCR